MDSSIVTTTPETKLNKSPKSSWIRTLVARFVGLLTVFCVHSFVKILSFLWALHFKIGDSRRITYPRVRLTDLIEHEFFVGAVTHGEERTVFRIEILYRGQGGNGWKDCHLGSYDGYEPNLCRLYHSAQNNHANLD